jgi:hypothetical protein
VDQRKLAQAGDLLGGEPGPQGDRQALAQMQLRTVQVTGPQRRRTDHGEQDRPRGVVAAVRDPRLQGQRLLAGRQHLVEVADLPRQRGVHDRQQQGEPSSPLLAQQLGLPRRGHQVGGGRVGVAAQDPVGGAQQRQLGIGMDQLGRQPGDKLMERGRVALQDQARPVPGHEVGRAAPVAGQEGLLDGAHRQSTCGIPAGGAPVQRADLGRRLTAELIPEQLGEQVVVPVGAAPRSDGGDEAVGPLQAGQHGLAAVAAGERVGQVAVQLVHDAGPQQEAAQLLRLPVEHFPGQVVGDTLVVAG